MSAKTYRRVVTGLNAEGRSCVVIDGPVPADVHSTTIVWRTAALPADNAGNADAARPYAMEMLHDGGSNFMLVTLPPGMGRFMHATDTIDYLVVLSGRIVIELEAGEAAMEPGDFIVDRGVLHAWRNDGPDDAVMITVTLPAHPVGQGRNV
jgi:quercetin dioxygenase-like cupin family protein